MSVDDDEPMLHLGEGCMVHGDEYMTECSVCGTEFCSRCTPGTHVCATCSETGDEDDDLDLKPASRKKTKDDEDDVDQLLQEADQLGLVDDEAGQKDGDLRD